MSMLATPPINPTEPTEDMDRVVEYQCQLGYKRYAIGIASDERLPHADRAQAVKIARAYDGILLKIGSAILDEFNHRRATIH
jgi:hypothetical protein